MASLIEQLDAIDLSALTQKLEAARRTVGVEGTVSIQALDPRDLLGELGALMKSDQPFGIDPSEWTTSVSAGLAKLDGLVQLPALPRLGVVLEGLERLVGLLEDALAKFGGSGEIDLDRLLPEIAGLQGFFEEVLGNAFEAVKPQVPGELAGVLAGLQALASRDPADARELAKLLAPLLLGLSFESLDAAAGRQAAAIDRLCAAGGDLQPIEAEMRRITASVRDVVQGLEAPEPSALDIETRVAQVRGDVGLLLRNTIPGALARLAQELHALDASRLAEEIRAALEPLLPAAAAPPFRLDADLLQPVRALADNIDRLTADDLARHFAAVEAEMTGVADSAAVAGLTKAVDDLFDIVIDTLREVPIRRMRQELLDELQAIEARIRAFDGFEVPQAIAGKLAAVEQRIASIDLAGVSGRATAFAQQLQGVVDQFPIEEIAQQAGQAAQALGDLMGEFTGALAELSKEVDALADQLKQVDFHVAGEAAIGLIADARGKVEQVLSSGDVPDVAKAGIGAAASTLKGFDFSVEISAPFDETLDGIDVSVITAPLDAVTARARESLAKVAPTALIAELEAPFERLLQELQRFRSDAIRAALSQEFQRLAGALDALKPERLVAPLQAQFTKLTDGLRQAIDPAPLVAPLHALYRRLLELLELLDLEKLLAKVLGRTAQMPQLLGGTMQNLVKQRLGGADAGADTDASAELFAWGDFVRPLAALVLQLRSRLEKLAGAMVAQALDLLDAPLRRLADLADAGSGFQAQVSHAVASRYRAIDLFAQDGAGEDLLVALHELDAAAASAAVDGELGIRLQGHLAAIRIDLDAHAALDLGRESVLRAAQVDAKFDAPDLAPSLARVGAHLRSLVPAGGLAGEATAALAARLDVLFAAVDFDGIATELDALGTRIRTKLEGFARQIAAAILRLVDRAIQAVLPVTPFGMLGRISAGMARVRAEFAVLDPAAIEQELRELVDALVDGLEMFSPAQLASQLNGVVESVAGKIRALDPSALLGDLSMIDGVIDAFGALRPSVLLAPLLVSAQDVTKAFDAILAIDLGASLRAAIDALRAELEAVVEQVQAEFTGLIGFLEAQGGGVSVKVSL